MHPGLRWHLLSPSATLGRLARAFPASCRVLGVASIILARKKGACPWENRNRPWIVQRQNVEPRCPDATLTRGGFEKNIKVALRGPQSCPPCRLCSHAGSAIDSRISRLRVALSYCRMRVVYALVYYSNSKIIAYLFREYLWGPGIYLYSRYL